MKLNRYRVAQFGTGHSGRRSLQAIIEHPLYDLVAVRVFSADKVGKDAGTLCGMAPVGVLTTDRLEDVLAARPDCLLYFPATGYSSVDDVCRVLGAGINIVTLLSEYHHPPSLDPTVRRRIEDACNKGQSSLYATGPDPGYLTGALPLGALSFQRRVDRIQIFEYADMSSRTADMNRQMWGWDPSTDNRFAAHAARMRQGFGEPFRQLAESIGLPLDDVIAEGFLAHATRDVDITALTIRQGTVAGARFEVKGWRQGKPLIEFVSTWWVTEHIDVDWKLRDRDGWRLVIEGDTPLDYEVRFAPAYGEIGNSSPYNAHICVNSVAACCEGPPGILTAANIPPIVPQFSDANV